MDYDDVFQGVAKGTIFGSIHERFHSLMNYATCEKLLRLFHSLI